MIDGPTREIVIREYQVSGEAAVPRPYSDTMIVAEVLTIEWRRNALTCWRVNRIVLTGSRAKADGTASRANAEATYSPTYREDRPVRWSGDVAPPEWALAIAVSQAPQDGPLPVVHDRIEPIDLDD